MKSKHSKEAIEKKLSELEAKDKEIFKDYATQLDQSARNIN